MKKRIISLLLVVVMLVSMMPAIAMEANAHSVVMTADEFIGYLQYIVDRGDSKYGSGNELSVGKYAKDDDGNYYIYFDCWGLGESIICTNGEIVYNRNKTLNPWNLWDTSCGCGSKSGDWLKTQCQLSSDFTNIVPGEWLFKDDSSGHCYHVGYYIGNGKVIESTSDGSYNTQITTIDGNGCSNIRSSSWKWTSHGMVPWIDYTAQTHKTPVGANGVDELSCASFISNEAHREYIDLMMKYHISQDENLSTALDNGESVVFMFEGGSDNYPSSTYSSSSSNVRNQAVVIVVQKKDTKYKIVFYCENSSSIPSQPKDTSGGSCDRQTTILDGIYKIQTCNHQGKYGALNVITDKGYYTPASNQDGWINNASGINIHTRSTNNAGSGDGAWSWGCQLIGTGGTSSNPFNEFMKVVAGINYNVWTKYASDLDKVTAGQNVGYYVVDRLLAKEGLSKLYTETALANITAASKAYYEKALESNCHIKASYHCYGQLTVTSDSTWVKSMPCSRETDPESDDVEGKGAQKGAQYTTTQLILNDQGNYWYKVVTDSGATGYIYAGDVSFKQKTDDADLNGESVPTEILQGKGYPVRGIVTTTYQEIVGVYIDVLRTVDGSTALSHYVQVDGMRYDLSSPEMDYNVKFNELPVGDYIYVISVKIQSNYAVSGKERDTTYKTVDLNWSTFSVVEEITCSHTYQSVVTPPTYTSEGYTTYTCTKCGHSYVGDYVAALVPLHSITFDPNGGTLPSAYAERELDGINVERAAGYLVVYNKSNELADTNKYGVEVQVDATGKVIAKRDYLSDSKMTVPDGGFVLSGQGANGSWVEGIAIGDYVAYDETAMRVYVYSSRGDYIAHHKQVESGNPIGLLPECTREGYLLKGWFTAAEGGQQVVETDIVTSDLKLYAQWEKECSNGHSFSEWTTTKPATCTEQGRQERTCSWCGAVETRTIEAKGHQYVANVIEGNCTELGKTIHTCSTCGDTYAEYNGGYWTEWSPAKPVGVSDELIESRTEYRYQTKQYTTSKESYLDGWTLYDTTVQWGDYGAWSEWSSDAVSADENTKVETRVVYGYYYYLCSNCGAHMHGYGTCWTWAGGCGATTKSGDWHVIWSEISWDNAGLKDWHGTGKYYTYLDGELVFKWTSGGQKTQYRYCTREEETVYCFYKWSAWSDWSASAVENGSEVNVETRTAYRYYESGLGEHQYDAVVTPPSCTERGYTTHTCAVCGDSYVDSYVDATGHHHELVDSKEPTATEDGYETWRCTGCGDEYTDTLPATGVAITWGDVNGDGSVNYMDAYLIMRYSVGLITGDGLDLTAADVSGDGMVNYMDAYLIMRWSVGLIDKFPVLSIVAGIRLDRGVGYTSCVALLKWY